MLSLLECFQRRAGVSAPLRFAKTPRNVPSCRSSCVCRAFMARKFQLSCNLRPIGALGRRLQAPMGRRLHIRNKNTCRIRTHLFRPHLWLGTRKKKKEWPGCEPLPAAKNISNISNCSATETAARALGDLGIQVPLLGPVGGSKLDGSTRRPLTALSLVFNGPGVMGLGFGSR
jgi:hypothetical protein